MGRKTSPSHHTAQGRVAKTRRPQLQRRSQHTLTRKNGSRHLDRLYTRECLLAQSREASERSPASDAMDVVEGLDHSRFTTGSEKKPSDPCLGQSMTVCLVITPDSKNPPHEGDAIVEVPGPECRSRESSPVSRTSHTTSPQRKRTSKRYSSRWSSGVQLAPLQESQEHFTQEIHQDGPEDQDWETVAGSQQFPFPPRSGLMLTHSEAGSSIADYTSYASFGTSEGFMSPPMQRRRRRYASLSSSPWHDSSMNFLAPGISSPPEQHSRSKIPRRIHTTNVLSDGYPRLPPSPKLKVVPVLPTTFTYRHPTPLERSHSNPFKVTPPYLGPGEDWQQYDEAESFSDPSIHAQEQNVPNGNLTRQPYLAGESIADMSTGMTSTWQSEADLNPSTPSTSIFQPSTPCPYGRTYMNRYRGQYHHQQVDQHCNAAGTVKADTPCKEGEETIDSSPIWRRISGAESPVSWYGSICNISDTELAGDDYADSTNLLWENKSVRRSYYHHNPPRSLRQDLSNGLRRLSNISSERHSRKSFVQLDDEESEKPVLQDPIIPKRCFIRKVSADADATAVAKRASQLDRDTTTEDTWKPRAKRNSGLSFKQRKREDELLRRRLTQIDLGSFTDVDLKEGEPVKVAENVAAAAPVIASDPYEFLPLRQVTATAKERVEGWLSLDLGTERQSAPITKTVAAAIDEDAAHQAKDEDQEWYRSEHGKYAFPQPPRLVNQTERHAIRRKSVHPLTSYPPPQTEQSSSPVYHFQLPGDNHFFEIEYIVKQRRLGKQILLILSILPPVGWLVVAYIGFHGSRSDGLMRWRSHGDVQEFHHKERRVARWLAMIQAVVMLVMVIVVPAAVLG